MSAVVISRLWLILVASAACVRSHATECGDYLCPESSRCVTYTPTGNAFCATDEDTACLDQPDGTLCDGDKGTCYGGACFPVGCGNGVIDDPVYAHPEQCDDGNRRSHDGCSSTCTNEVATWTVEAPGAIPGLATHAMAYDSGRDTFVVFGGDRGGIQGETWLRVAGQWQFVRPADGAPSQRKNHAMTYDGARQRVVLFGGLLGNGTSSDETWDWDGARWTPRTPANRPPPREGHAMAFDPIRGVVVLFGGADPAAQPLADTWTWDGNDWTEVTGSAPPAMTEHAMVFDPVRGELIVVGESGGQVETWRFDGAAWSRAASGGPPHATSITLAYDPVTRTVLWTGDTGGALVQWEWTGAQWRTQPVSALPTVTSDAAAATGVAGPFVFGGFATNGVVQAAHEWDGTAWRSPKPTIAPASRQGMAVAIDSRRGSLQIIGDDTATSSTAKEVWELAAGRWQLVSSAYPLLDSIPALAVYDDARRATVVVRFTQSASWDGVSWVTDSIPAPSLRTPQLAYIPGAGDVLVAGLPTGIQPPITAYVRGASGAWVPSGAGPDWRSDHTIGYDPVANTLMLFGGTAGSFNFATLLLNDTWSWNPTTRVWSELSPLRQPLPRASASLPWDGARKRLVLVGGNATGGISPRDIWEWDRTRATWQSIIVAGTPPEPILSAAIPLRAVSAPDGDGVVVLRDLSFGEINTLALFRLRWDGPGPLEGCRGTLDLDHDGLAGCDDPDCAVACAIAATTCGNGACDATESSVSCPGDCPRHDWCGDFTCAAGETPETCPGDCGMPSSP